MKKIKYQVWSTHEDAADRLETTRTDEAAAKQDKDIIQSIFHRHVWIREVE